MEEASLAGAVIAPARTERTRAVRPSKPVFTRGPVAAPSKSDDASFSSLLDENALSWADDDADARSPPDSDDESRDSSMLVRRVLELEARVAKLEAARSTEATGETRGRKRRSDTRDEPEVRKRPCSASVDADGGALSLWRAGFRAVVDAARARWGSRR